MVTRPMQKVKKTYEIDVIYDDVNYNFNIETYTKDGALINAIRYLSKELGLEPKTDDYDNLVTAMLDIKTQIKEVKKSLITF